MNTYEGLEKVLRQSKTIPEDLVNEILENTKVFFEFRDFMCEKHYIEGEDMDALIEKMVQLHTLEYLENLPDRDDMLEYDDQIELMGNMYQEFATKQGFDKPIKESLMLILKYTL